jgi:N-acylneuraminate cytidylyltransferase
MPSLDDISIVIPVREGSSRISEKIYLPFGPSANLLEWKIDQLLHIHRPDRIFISSNSDRISKIAQNMGVIYLPRSEYLCNGHKATFSEVICGIVADLPTSFFAWVTVVVPLMRPSEYLDAFNAFLEHVCRQGNCDSLVTVNYLKDYLWQSGMPLNYQANRNHTISQNLPDLFRVTNGLYMREKDATLREGYFLGSRPFMHVVGKMSGIDIDEQEDYEIALALKAVYSKR